MAIICPQWRYEGEVPEFLEHGVHGWFRFKKEDDFMYAILTDSGLVFHRSERAGICQLRDGPFVTLSAPRTLVRPGNFLATLDSTILEIAGPDLDESWSMEDDSMTPPEFVPPDESSLSSDLE